MVGLVGGCVTDPPGQTGPPSPTPTAIASGLRRDFLAPGEAPAVVRELVEAAGTNNAIKLELTRARAALSVVSGTKATTWAWRDGTIAVVESDTQFVDQAIFDPRDYNLSDVAGMFQTAGRLSRSSQEQELQIVEYADRAVYMTVTTNPESQTIFFHKDGRLVAPLDLSTVGGITEALHDAVGDGASALGVGILPNQGGLWVDTAATGQTVVRTLRMPRFPARSSIRRDPGTLRPFPSSVVSPEVIVATRDRLLAKLKTSLSPNWSVTVEDRDREPGGPRMYWALAGDSVTTTLTGAEVGKG